MNRLIKDKDIILDGTLSRNEKTIQAFEKLGEIEEIIEKHEIESIKELDNILNDFDSLCEDVIRLSAIITAYREYAISIGKEQEAKSYIQNFLKDLKERNENDGLL